MVENNGDSRVYLQLSSKNDIDFFNSSRKKSLQNNFNDNLLIGKDFIQTASFFMIFLTKERF